MTGYSPVRLSNRASVAARLVRFVLRTQLKQVNIFTNANFRSM